MKLGNETTAFRLPSEGHQRKTPQTRTQAILSSVLQNGEVGGLLALRLPGCLHSNPFRRQRPTQLRQSPRGPRQAGLHERHQYGYRGCFHTPARPLHARGLWVM
ncbi:hypothetical protein GOP47_0019355 [Adiantum capillus-veneris]|uniref:Uncharacterized protein n=1 Tax=Adiantum capillus-veneris TaxID=13818 RepID=A0A9D4ZBK3_ADICA|nr:hypothetical protein GOP47_0019355 [Adiantum capillus-veneris]